MEIVFNRIMGYISEIKKIDLNDYNERHRAMKMKDWIIDLIQFFELELAQAGYEPALLEAMEYFNSDDCYNCKESKSNCICGNYVPFNNAFND